MFLRNVPDWRLTNVLVWVYAVQSRPISFRSTIHFGETVCYFQFGFNLCKSASTLSNQLNTSFLYFSSDKKQKVKRNFKLRVGEQNKQV